MGEKILRYDLAELKSFRFRCKKCGKGVAEVPIQRLESAAAKDGVCHFCDEVHLPGADSERLEKLKDILAWLANDSRRFSVEIDLPANRPDNH